MKQNEDSFENNSTGLLNYMQTLLDSVDHRKVELWSISHVPEQLRKSKAEAYIPQVVSIGPVHRGTKPSLLDMEEIKWPCMKHLFRRTVLDEETCLRSCSRAMWKLDEVARASYVDDVKFNRNDLTKISTLDGCFLLELLITGSPEFGEQIKGAQNLLSPSPGDKVIRREEVLSDLMLLENQIPFIVLDVLLRVLFDSPYNDAKLIQKRALSILGYNYSLDSGPSKFKATHLVELVHSFIDEERGVDFDSAKIDIDELVWNGKPKLRHCTTRLEAAGVTITGLETNNEPPYRFDLKIKFSDGKLEIPQMHITRTTEAKWRNFIAWELSRSRQEIHRGSKEKRTRCLFISYAWFFQSLICCVHDVKLLRDRNVILVDVVESDESDEDLLDLFRMMTKGVSRAEIEMDPWFAQEIRKLNSFKRTAYLATETWTVICHKLFGILPLIWYMCTYSIRGLIAAYLPTRRKLIGLVGAIAALALTAIQTAYAMNGMLVLEESVPKKQKFSPTMF